MRRSPPKGGKPPRGRAWHRANQTRNLQSRPAAARLESVDD